MLIKILAVGDVSGEVGLDLLHKHLRTLIQTHQVDFTIVNAENIAGIGLLPHQAESVFNAGADVITLGNHTWGKQQITNYLDDNPYILRPANFAPQLPGSGFGVFDGPHGLRIGVMNLIGRMNLDIHASSPFLTADRLLENHNADLILVDFHAETTSEKGALAWHLDGKVQALWGTHTHVPTADLQILPKGLGFVSDLGMVGPKYSVLGIEPADSINLFLGGLPRRHTLAKGKGKLNSVLFTIDTETNACVNLIRCDIEE